VADWFALCRCAVVLFFACAACAQARALGVPVTTQVDVTWNGAPPEVGGVELRLSADGRFVAFSSSANNLIPGDTNGSLDGRDVFVRDRAQATTTRVSVASNGEQGNGASDVPSISGSGRFVAFSSYASNLVRRDGDEDSDVFVHDRRTGKTTLVSVASDGTPANGDADFPAISANGRFVAFTTWASNLAPVRGFASRVYVHDRRTGKTTLVSPVRGDAAGASISGDGRVVAFRRAGRRGSSIRVYDRRTGRTWRADVSSHGRAGNGSSGGPSLSRTGRFVAFSSRADNLVAGDHNHGPDVFVRDRAKNSTQRVTIRPDGTPIRRCPHSSDVDEDAPVCATGATISGSGRYVVFLTELRRFDDAGVHGGVFMRDRRAGRTTRISISPSGKPVGFAETASISADGRAAAFIVDDIFVRAPLK
jgi:Tol biopolymer transport system component